MFGVLFPLAALHCEYHSIILLDVFPCALLIAIVFGPPRVGRAGLFSALADFVHALADPVVFVGGMVMLICTTGACLVLAATILRLLQFHIALVEHALHLVLSPKLLTLYTLHSQQTVLVGGTLLVTLCMLFCTLAYLRNSLLFPPRKIIAVEDEEAEEQVPDREQDSD